MVITGTMHHLWVVLLVTSFFRSGFAATSISGQKLTIVGDTNLVTGVSYRISDPTVEDDFTVLSFTSYAEGYVFMYENRTDHGTVSDLNIDKRWEIRASEVPNYYTLYYTNSNGGPDEMLIMSDIKGSPFPGTPEDYYVKVSYSPEYEVGGSTRNYALWEVRLRFTGLDRYALFNYGMSGVPITVTSGYENREVGALRWAKQGDGLSGFDMELTFKAIAIELESKYDNDQDSDASIPATFNDSGAAALDISNDSGASAPDTSKDSGAPAPDTSNDSGASAFGTSNSLPNLDDNTSKNSGAATATSTGSASATSSGLGSATTATTGTATSNDVGGATATGSGSGIATSSSTGAGGATSNGSGTGSATAAIKGSGAATAMNNNAGSTGSNKTPGSNFGVVPNFWNIGFGHGGGLGPGGALGVKQNQKVNYKPPQKQQLHHHFGRH